MGPALSLLTSLTTVTAPWRSAYSHSPPLEMSVVGVHVLSMFVAGGLAIAHDRSNLRAGRWTRAIRQHHVGELHAVHTTVVAALAICVLSGLLLFASDVKTYAVSIPFWIKMGLIVLLLANALVMTSVETALRVDSGGAATAAWSRIRASSAVSASLWAAIVLVSIVLSLAQ